MIACYVCSTPSTSTANKKNQHGFQSKGGKRSRERRVLFFPYNAAASSFITMGRWSTTPNITSGRRSHRHHFHQQTLLSPSSPILLHPSSPMSQRCYLLLFEGLNHHEQSYSELFFSLSSELYHLIT